MKNITILAILNLQCWTINLEQIKQNKAKPDRARKLFCFCVISDSYRSKIYIKRGDWALGYISFRF